MPNQLNVYFTADPSSPMDPLDAPSDSVIFYAAMPFTIEVENHTKNWNGTLSYSTDGSSWTTWTGTTVLTAAKTGYWYRIYMKGSSNTIITGGSIGGTATNCDRYSDRRFIITNTGTDVVMCKGNLAKLLGPSVTAINTASCFANLFRGNAYVDFDVILPNVNASQAIYAGMFYGCSSMTKAPAINFTASIANGACMHMFRGCAKLKTPPTITATTKTIGTAGFHSMFMDCLGLKSIPEIMTQACTVGSYGCYNMFRGCTNLSSVNFGSLTTSTTYAFGYICYECTGLKTIVALPSAALDSYAFQYAFARCSQLENLPQTWTLKSKFTSANTYEYMFQYCMKLTTPNNLTLITDTGTGTHGSYQFRYLFSYCYALNDVSRLVLDDSLSYSYALQGMFYGCTALVIPPTLPNTSTIYGYMYNNMFYGCTALTTAPEIKGDTVNGYGCAAMFYGCTALVNVPKLPANTIGGTYAYYQMFRGCTKLTTLPALPALVFKERCYSQMFYGCSLIKLSETQTGDYQTEYRIPTTGTGTTATNALTDIFTSTGGTFKGTAVINTTYYTSNTIVSAT